MGALDNSSSNDKAQCQDQQISASLVKVISKRFRIPAKLHHLSVFKRHIKLRTVFTDKHCIKEGMQCVFFFNSDTSVSGDKQQCFLLVTSLNIPHAATLRYLSSYGIKDRRLSIWREPVCEQLRGLFIDACRLAPATNANTPCLRLRCDMLQTLPIGQLFSVSPTTDLHSLH